MAAGDIVEKHGLAWVEFRDEETRRYLGKMNLRTGHLSIMHRGQEVQFNLTPYVKAAAPGKSADGRHSGTSVLK